jgi:polyisoprenoid-binding protein YceI
MHRMARTLPWIIAVALALGGMPAARAAEPPTYALDPVHTRVMFAVEHAGFSQALGTLSGSTGLLRFDPDDWTTATLRAEIPLARLDLGDDKWNRAALARNLLDAEAHPVATFTSTRIEPLADNRARVHGMLDLRGVSREVVLEVRLNARKRHPLPPFRRTVGFSATATLSRADFGITAWKSVIGDSIELRIEAEATRTRVDGDEGEDPGGDAAAPTPPEPTSMDDSPAEPEPAAAPEAMP